MKMNIKDVAEHAAKSWIEMFQDPLFWQKPWTAERGALGFGGSMPYNGLTGRLYTAGNMPFLWAVAQQRGYKSAAWMTYHQKTQAGLSFNEDAKGQGIYIPCFKPIAKSNASPEGQDEKDDRKRGAMLRWYLVWNCDLIEGFQERIREQPTAQWRHGECERLLADSGAKIFHGGDQAFYRPRADTIHLPNKEAFKSADGYYATALHELGHWTGHEDRLKRDLSGPFGSESYAKEELVAELSSFLIGDRLGIGHDPRQHAAYAKHWIKMLQDDPTELLRAASKAEKVCTFLGIEAYQHEPMQVVEREKTNEAEGEGVAKPKRTRRWKTKKTQEATAEPVAARGRSRKRDMAMTM